MNQASHGQIRAVASALKSGTILSVLNALGVEGMAGLSAKVWPVIPVGLLSDEKKARLGDRLKQLSPSDIAQLAGKVNSNLIDRVLSKVANY